MEAAEIKEVATKFDTFMRSAIEAKYMRMYSDHYLTVIEQNVILRWNLVDFIDRYVEAGVYPEERLPGLIYRLIDFKLELYYIQEVDLGIYNRIYFDDPRYNQEIVPPDLLLVRLSFDQNLIGKSRVLWERLMQSIYYLEWGKSIEGKSVKGKFFNWARSTQTWQFLVPYEAVIEEFDQNYRTPEFHKGSRLRGEILGSAKIDLNELMTLLNRAVNGVWDNLTSITTGGHAIAFTDLHMTPGGNLDIDPKYLPPST